MTAALAAVIIQQQGAETHIATDIGIDKSRIAVFYRAGNIIGHIAAIQKIQVDLKILIGGKIILEKHAKVTRRSVGRI
jgi:hypothetical protein